MDVRLQASRTGSGDQVTTVEAMNGNSGSIQQPASFLAGNKGNEMYDGKDDADKDEATAGEATNAAAQVAHRSQSALCGKSAPQSLSRPCSDTLLSLGSF